MATYRSIASSETDAESPITQELMDALALNPPAIAEGASGAPKIEAIALDTVVLVIPETTSSTTKSHSTTNPFTTAFFEIVETMTASGSDGDTASIRYRTATDGGSTPTSWTTIFSSKTLNDGTVAEGSLVTLPTGTNYIEIDTETTATRGTGFCKVTIGGVL